MDCSNANGACVINLMILYSLDVELKYINLTPIGFMLANQINNALKNSKISHRINLVAVLPIDDNFPEGNEEQERGLLKQLLADPISVTGMNKNFHKADLTMVLTSGKNYKTNNGFKTVGFAFTPSTNANEGAVINIDFALSRSYTFAHEFGHLLNARHNDDNGALPGRGHQISFRAKNYSTLLDKRDLSKRVLFYSNPNVNYYGQVPTGLADYYNACNMEQQGCNAALSGPSEDCKFRIKGTFSPIGSLPCNPPATQLTLEATLANEATSLCLQKTFFYKFEISHFGITYNSLCDWSTNKICIFSPYINFNNSVFIRLSIKESLNGPVIAIVFNKFDYPCPFGVPYLEHRAKLSASISNNIVLVSNTVPSTSFLKFFTDPIENNVIDYKICSIFGNAIISTRVNQTNGDIIIPIEGNYPPGVYLVYFEKYQKSFKFIIQ
ncbi:MAG: hypothetical protein IPJ43_03235 [Saprospiraceae bacterium]|nr:hypothetical protein [Saprospiraceae bacterium]